MIRTNLATRPFYNERAVRAVLLGVTLLVIAASAINVIRVMQYSGKDTELATRASQDEARAAELRVSANRLRATVDAKQIDLASAEALHANELIDRRTFSWTELLNRFETTLPDNVRLTAVRPKVDAKRGIVLTISVVARGVEDVSELMNNLEGTGAFADLLTPEEHFDEDGQLHATVETTYQPQGVPAANPPKGAKSGAKRR
jgi:Tfp pilus assembly protein PilN